MSGFPWPIHPGRLAALASNTFTQLVRQRVFYFLLLFAALILAVGLLIDNISTDRTRELRVVKDLAFFAMSIFSTIFAIAATANLLPKDMEDRTLYTILAKSVPRLEYLLGKYLGVLMVAAISLAVMTGLLYAALAYRQQALLTPFAGLEAREDVAGFIAAVRRDGATWRLLQGVLAIFFQASVLSALALFVSSFASSGLFTIIITIFVYLIGFAQPVVIEYWRHEGQMGGLSAVVLRLFELLFPNFQSFNVIDGIVAGESLPAATLVKLASLAVSYAAAYLFAAYLFFAKKEL